MNSRGGPPELAISLESSRMMERSTGKSAAHALGNHDQRLVQAGVVVLLGLTSNTRAYSHLCVEFVTLDPFLSLRVQQNTSTRDER